MADEARDTLGQGGHDGFAPLRGKVPRGAAANASVELRKIARWVADAVVSVVFPAECRICDRLLATASRVPVCEPCLGGFEPLGRRICAVCGTPLERPARSEAERDGERVCRACAERRYGFDRARSFAHYDRGLVQTILLLKFERIDPLAEWFAARLAELAQQEGLTDGIDVVVPVPLHRERQRERGFNQADLIARAVARRLRLPYRPVLLVRTKPRPNKHTLSLEERWESVRGAFATLPGSQVDKQSVLLVDDVMTTGATLDACARALREAGAKRVMGLTVARAVRDVLPSSSEQ